MARSEPIADASLPDIRARSNPGTAIAAMMPIIATTISSSIRVKPLESRIFISVSPEKVAGGLTRPGFVSGERASHLSNDDARTDQVRLCGRKVFTHYNLSVG